MKEETKLGDTLSMRSSGRDVNTGLLPMFVDGTYLMDTARHKKHCNESKKIFAVARPWKGRRCQPPLVSKECSGPRDVRLGKK
jgi:hypothetical protein